MLLIHVVDLREYKQKQVDVKENSRETRNQLNLKSEINENYYHEQRLQSGHHFCEIYLLTNSSCILIGLISFGH